jgi:hypothetical protein
VLYLLDANVLITAHNFYYPLDRVPEFWGWLVHVGSEGHVKIPLELYEEITEGNDALVDWARDDDNRSTILFEEVVDIDLVSRVSSKGMRPTSPTTKLKKSDVIPS